MKRLLCVLFLLFLPSSYAYPHEMWIERKGTTYEVWYGHKEAEEKDNVIEYKPENVLEVRCFDSEGNEVDAAVRREFPATLQGDCAVVYSLFSSGYWTKTPYGTKNIAKDKAETPIYSWRSIESAKRMNEWNENLRRPLTDSLEITPLNDPFELKKGEKLRLLVSFRGEPVQDAVISYDEKTRGTTDEKGRINIRIKSSGLQIISASYKEKITSEKADEVVYGAHLNFEVE